MPAVLSKPEEYNLTDNTERFMGRIVFLDSAVKDYQSLVAGVIPGTEVIVLDAKGDGVEQISKVLTSRRNISSLHIVSHGEPGGVQLGAAQLSINTLEKYAPQLQNWAAALTDEADILLYGCQAAAGPEGAAFVQSLSQLTGATVAASTTQTGSAALGGNWNLDVSTGPLKTALAFSSSVMEAYDFILNTPLREPVIVKDIVSGLGSSNPQNLTNVNGTLYFTTDPSSLIGPGLWKSDGTAAGTTRVKNIFPSSSSSEPSSLTSKPTYININGILYFTANDGLNGSELWKSDGTANGTTLVKDIFPGSLSYPWLTYSVPGSSDPQNLTNVNGILYFTAYDGLNGRELWKLDTLSKNLNDAPIVVSTVPDQTATEDAVFTLQFDANTFGDVNPDDKLSYSATLGNKPLPSWLTFNAETRTFRGIPTNRDVGNLNIKVTATDGGGASVSDAFNLAIASKSSLKGDGLKAVYYNNLDFTGPSVTQVSPTVDFAWGQDEPAADIGADTFSVRWTGQVQAQYSEPYTFYTQSDDGVRLWVNDQLLIDDWNDHGLTENSGIISLAAGQKYNIKMEFYDNVVDATAKLLWSSPTTPKAVIPQAQLYSNSGDGLQAVYYDNTDFTGPSVTQINPTVNYNWGKEAPTPGIGADTFSVRWTGQVEPLYTERYNFYSQSDDGVRLWVNDQLLIDDWNDHGLTEKNGSIYLQAGRKYNIKMEFYDNAVDATAKLLWSSPNTPEAVIPQSQLFSNSGNSLLAASSNSLNSASNTAFAASAIPSSSNGGQTDVLLGNQATKANDIQLKNSTGLAQNDATTSEPNLTWSIGGSSNSSSQTGIQQGSLATGVTDLWSMNGRASNSGAVTVPALDPNWQLAV